MTQTNFLLRKVSVQIPQQILAKQSDLNKTKSTSEMARNLTRVQNSPDRLSNQEDLFAELKSKLASRKIGVGGSEKISFVQELKSWQKELIEQKKAYALKAPDREAAEKKEEARVATALNIEAAEKAKLKASEVCKVNTPVIQLKLDANGIPLPPPPPMIMPMKSINITRAVNKPNAQKNQPKRSESLVELTKELTAKLAKRGGEMNIMNKPALEKLKPWQKELYESQQSYKNSAPDRLAAEAKEEKRVAAALRAEAAEKIKQQSAAAQNSNKAIAALKLDENGIPLPPPPPSGLFK